LANRRITRTKSFSAYLSSINDDVAVLQARQDVTGRGLENSAVTSNTFADEISLISNGIRSSNYIPNYSGWRISGAGVAEFSDVFVRGDINAYSGTIGYWNISSPAVSRIFGNTTLYGTFLESSDIGDSDVNKTDGSYVGLFKSYSVEPNPIVFKYRKDNIATITTPNHPFIVGDLVYVSVVGDTSFGYASTPVAVISTTGDTISYINEGPDFTNLDPSDVPVDNSASGTVTLYNHDVAGLYLRDYSKSEFDYGYFSNTGVAYVSAEDINIIENPSFEYRDSAETLQNSSASWATTGAGPSFSLVDITTSSSYKNDSIWGGRLSWSTASSEYLSSTIDYTAGSAYNTFDSGRSLYLGFTAFPYYVPETKTVSSIQSYTSGGSWFLEVTTSTNHGWSAGDTVFFDLTATRSGTTYIPHAMPNGETGYTFVIAASPAPTATKFYVPTQGTFSSAGLALTTVALRGGINKNVYKAYEAALDLSEIRIRYSNGQTTPLANVLSTITRAQWDAGNNKHLISIANTYMLEYVDPDLSISPMTKTDIVLVDGASIAAEYQAKDSSGFAANSDIYLDIPAWLYKHDGNSVVSSTKITDATAVGYILDNAYVSSAPNFFYGSALSTNRWYGTTDDVISYDPAQASIEESKTWINVDLDSQAAYLDYFSYLGFKNYRFSKAMTVRPAITMKDASSVYQTFPDTDYDTLTLTGGQYQYLTSLASSYTNLSPVLKLTTGETSSAFELSSSYRGIDTGDGSELIRKGVVISGLHDGTDFYDTTTLRFGSDRLIWTEDTDNLSLAASERFILEYDNATATYISTFNIPVEINSNNLSVNSGNILLDTGDITATAGVITANRLRLPSATQYNLTSTTHPLQIGNVGSTNLRFDDNGVQAVSASDTVSTLNINTFGGNVVIGSSSSVLTSQGDFLIEPLIGASTTGASINAAGYLIRTPSSERYKQDINDASYSYEDILSLQPKTFKLKEEVVALDNPRIYAGFIAEDLDKLETLKIFVNYSVQEDGSKIPDGVQYGEMVSALVSAIKHQHSIIQELSARVVKLEGK